MSKSRHRIAREFVLIFFGLMHACLAQEQATRATGSLLFSPAQQRAIEAALAVRPPEGSVVSSGVVSDLLHIPEDKPAWRIERLHLSALIYYDPKKWTLWFGNRQVRQNNVPPFLVNLQVTANYVDLSVISRPGADPIPVRLRPNQTFLINQLRIDEGGQKVN